MQPAPAYSPELAPIGEALLSAFQVIADSAIARLAQPMSVDPYAPPAVKAEVRRVARSLEMALHALTREPTIARVEVDWLDKGTTEIYYVCRSSGASVSAPADGRLVSYRAALGRLAEIPAGEDADIVTPGGRREAFVRSRVLVRPTLQGRRWDAFNNSFEFVAAQYGVDSLQRLLSWARANAEQDTTAALNFLDQLAQEDERALVFFDQKRRRVVDRMELRDQPVLDQFQGSVFRLPLDSQVILLGPPGTGKTTTLIKRLAQKQTEDALTSDELEDLDKYGLRGEFLSEFGWAMFSPTDLLKLYVREAFNRETVPASERNLRTWAQERTTLGRDVLRVLKSVTGGQFTLVHKQHLLDHSSPALSSLFDEFSQYLEESVVSRASEALQWLERTDNEHAQKMARGVRSVFCTTPLIVNTLHDFVENDFLKNAIAGLEAETSSEQQYFAGILLSSDPAARFRTLQELVGSSIHQNLGSAEDAEDDDEEMDESAESLDAPRAGKLALVLRLTKALAEHTAQGRSPAPRSVLGRASEWIEVRRFDATQLARLKELGWSSLVTRRLRKLRGASRQLVFGAAREFGVFRKLRAAEGRIFHPDAVTTSRSLTPLELDVVILAMLRNAERTRQRLPNAPWLQTINQRRLMQVFVDEMTDFSAVQIACMLHLTDRRMRSFFACGDLRQRITGSGISDRSELDWISRTVGIRNLTLKEINKGYRQSERLRLLAEALENAEVCPPDTQDPLPLLGEGLAGANLGSWLSDRIIEVEKQIGRMPSVAVFVPSEEMLDPVVEACRPLLAESNIDIVACREGRDVGNSQEVRVFDIRHIKGLEFEAVFFVGVDQLASQLPDLFSRFLYVGVTRAATFLGLTCETALPAALEHARHHFGHGAWA